MSNLNVSGTVSINNFSASSLILNNFTINSNLNVLGSTYFNNNINFTNIQTSNGTGTGTPFTSFVNYTLWCDTNDNNYLKIKLI
jgi:hypothetical protein